MCHDGGQFASMAHQDDRSWDTHMAALVPYPDPVLETFFLQSKFKALCRVRLLVGQCHAMTMAMPLQFYAPTDIKLTI